MRGVGVLWAVVLASAVVAPADALALGGISGTVTAKAGGAPVAGFAVQAYTPGAATPVTTTCTAADGTYAIPIETGSYEVLFTGDAGLCGPRSSLAPEWFKGRGPREFADPVVVSDGATTGNVDASLVDGGSIAGPVTAAAGGTPLANITVDLLNTSNTVVTHACTAADGTYRIDPLQGGVYSVRFSAAGTCGSAGQYQQQWYNGSASPAGAEAVGLVDGQDMAGVNAALLAGSPAPSTFTLTVMKAGTGTGTVTSQPAGIDCGPTCSHAFPVAPEVTLAAVPAPGSVFAGWKGLGCTGTGSCTVQVNADGTVAAAFAAASARPVAAPATALTRATIKRRRRSATFRFTSTGGTAPVGFECSLAKNGAAPKFRPCTSPKRYRKLKQRRYVFRVRAVDASGQRDTSPARKRFRT
ncbi:MAG: hypothetical protein QOF76_1180 [Solirubrobacteraceae bacterium]|nr:hypothetical protein [Solirubrobacteraceae bacterium]